MRDGPLDCKNLVFLAKAKCDVVLMRLPRHLLEDGDRHATLVRSALRRGTG